MLPSQGVVIPSVFSFHRVLVVTNISTSTNPSFPLFGSSLRVYKRSHPMVIQWVRLHQVDDVETVRFASFNVRNTEVEPLCVATRVIIRLQDQVILILVYLDRPSQITTLEPWLKEQSHVFWPCWDIKWGYLTLYSLCFLSLEVGTRVDTIVNDPIHETFLMSYPLGFSPQWLF